MIFDKKNSIRCKEKKDFLIFISVLIISCCGYTPLKNKLGQTVTMVKSALPNIIRARLLIEMQLALIFVSFNES